MSVVPATVGRRDLKEEILAEATRLFAAHGFQGTAVREVVEACGCTKPALYYYFENKDELFRAVVDRQIGRLQDIFSALHVDEPGPIRPRILGALRLVTDFLQKNPDGLRLLHRLRMRAENDSEQPAFDSQAIVAHQMHVLETLVRHGIAAGEIRANVRPADAGLLLVGFVDYALHRCVFDGLEWSEDALERCLNLIFEGIQP